jgi:hypothetical protein
MSDNPTAPAPPPAPETPPPATTTTETAPKPAVKNPIGWTASIAGLVIGAVPLLALALGRFFTITTLSGVQTVATTGVILVAASMLVALIGLVVSLVRKSTPATIIAAVTFVGMAAFLFTTVLPRVNNLQYLNNTLAPFGKSIQTYCQNPLNKTTADYKRAVADAPVISPSEPISTILQQLATFSTAMATDDKTFQQDATNLQPDLANLQKLTPPSSRYQPLVSGCIKDVQSTIAFLNDTTSQQIPTTQFLQGLDAGVAALPTSTLPAKQKPVVLAIIHANVPASFDVITLLQTASQYAACANPFGTCPVTLTLPTGVPASAVSQLSTLIFPILGVGYDQFVNAAMTQAANAKDPALTAAGNQLKQDIENILTSSLAPINVDAAAIVNNS